MDELTLGLKEYIEASPTPYHAVENAERILRESGFERIEAKSSGRLEAGKGYYFSRTGFTGGCATSLMAFILPSDGVKPKGVRVCASHTDSPCFRLKPNAVMEGGDYCRLNTERYGGAINSTWLDRPLAIAGRVIIRDGDKTVSKTVKLDGNVIMPNVAPHMNNQINSGYVYSAHTDLVPLLGDKGSAESFRARLAGAAGCEYGDIIDYDLSVYNPASALVWGGN